MRKLLAIISVIALTGCAPKPAYTTYIEERAAGWNPSKWQMENVSIWNDIEIYKYDTFPDGSTKKTSLFKLHLPTSDNNIWPATQPGTQPATQPIIEIP